MLSNLPALPLASIAGRHVYDFLKSQKVTLVDVGDESAGAREDSEPRGDKHVVFHRCRYLQDRREPNNDPHL